MAGSHARGSRFVGFPPGRLPSSLFRLRCGVWGCAPERQRPRTRVKKLCWKSALIRPSQASRFYSSVTNRNRWIGGGQGCDVWTNLSNAYARPTQGAEDQASASSPLERIRRET